MELNEYGMYEEIVHADEDAELNPLVEYVHQI